MSIAREREEKFYSSSWLHDWGCCSWESGKELKGNEEEDPCTYWDGNRDGDDEEDNWWGLSGCMLHQLGFPAIICFVQSHSQHTDNWWYLA